MDIVLLRDWIIIVLGILEIILIIAFIVAILVLYNKVNRLIGKGKQAIYSIERAFTNPYNKAGSWLFRCLAGGLSVFDKKQAKGGRSKNER